MKHPMILQDRLTLATPGEFTIKQLAEKIIEMTGSKSKLTFEDLPVDDPLQRKPVIDKAQEQTGLEARNSAGNRTRKNHCLFQNNGLINFYLI